MEAGRGGGEMERTGSLHMPFIAGDCESLRAEGREFSGPQMALAYRLGAISQGPNTLDFQGPTPLPLAQVMDAARIKSITHGAV
jgi:hypothetical protein